MAELTKPSYNIIIQEFIKRQKISKQYISNPWSLLLLDDCTDDPKLFKKPLFQGLYKNGRHWKMWYILSLQYYWRKTLF